MVEKIKNFVVTSDAKVKIKYCGNITEIKYVRHKNKEIKIKKLNDEQYVIINSGEVREFKRYENRSEDFQSLRQSMERLRDYINTNVTNIKNCRWLTLTYAENMRNTEKIYQDFKSFNRACRKKCGKYEYICSVEPQARGSFHYHVILIFPEKAPFMDNNDVASIWKHGFVNIRKLQNIDNLGVYLTAYLCNISTEELKENIPDNFKFGKLEDIEVEENGSKISKAIIKGGRLSMYPRGCHLYRISKGIKKPVIETMTNEKAMQRVIDCALTYEVTFQVTDNENEAINIINKRFFNRLRKNK